MQISDATDVFAMQGEECRLDTSPAGANQQYMWHGHKAEDKRCTWASASGDHLHARSLPCHRKRRSAACSCMFCSAIAAKFCSRLLDHRILCMGREYVIRHHCRSLTVSRKILTCSRLLNQQLDPLHQWRFVHLRIQEVDHLALLPLLHGPLRRHSSRHDLANVQRRLDQGLCRERPQAPSDVWAAPTDVVERRAEALSSDGSPLGKC